MAQERIELRFSPGNPNERALIDALGALGDEYGAKGRFLKERLLQGYAAILRELDGFMQESDPMAALDRVAASVDAKHYRVLKVLLTSKVGGQGSVQPQAQQVSAPASAPVAAPVVERPIQPVQAVSEPAVTAPAAPAASVSPEAAVAVVPAVNEAAAQVLAQAPAPVVQPEPEIEAQQPEHVAQAQASGPDAGPADGTDAAVEQPASPPPRKHDWSAFAGIAGAKKGG